MTSTTTTESFITVPAAVIKTSLHVLCSDANILKDYLPTTESCEISM